MNTADGGMMCLHVGDDGTTNFIFCDSDDVSQRFFVRAQYYGGFILQPAAVDFVDKCLSTDDHLSVVKCDFGNLPKWTVNVDGRIVPVSAQNKCLSHDPSNGNNARVSTCVKNDYVSHISIIPFRTSSQTATSFPSSEPGLSSIYPNSGLQLYGNGAYSTFKIDGCNILLTDETTLGFKFQIDGVSSIGTYEVCIIISGVVGSYCLNLIDPQNGFVKDTEATYELKLSHALQTNSNYKLLDFERKSQVVSSILFKQSGVAATSRSRAHSISLYNLGSAEIVDRKYDEFTMTLLFQEEINTDGVYFKSR